MVNEGAQVLCGGPRGKFSKLGARSGPHTRSASKFLETAAWTAVIIVRRDLPHRENVTLRVQRHWQARELPLLWTDSGLM